MTQQSNIYRPGDKIWVEFEVGTNLPNQLLLYPDDSSASFYPHIDKLNIVKRIPRVIKVGDMVRSTCDSERSLKYEYRVKAIDDGKAWICYGSGLDLVVDLDTLY